MFSSTFQVAILAAIICIGLIFLLLSVVGVVLTTLVSSFSITLFISAASMGFLYLSLMSGDVMGSFW